MGKIGITELVLILTIALVIFGPSKLPSIGKSIGLAIGEFKNRANKISEDVMTSTDDEKKDEKKSE